MDGIEVVLPKTPEFAAADLNDKSIHAAVERSERSLPPNKRRSTL